jgi:hypothetical protein
MLALCYNNQNNVSSCTVCLPLCVYGVVICCAVPLLNCFHVLCVAMAVFDLMYGLLDLPWDTEPTKEFIETFLKQIMAINNKPSYVVVLYHTMPMTTMVHEALTEAHFQHLTPFFWHKTNHLTQTPVSSYTHSVECGTIAFKPSRDKCDWNVSKDPRERHNFIDTPAITTYRKDASGNIINQCQKPAALGRWLFGNHCAPGSTVLVLGAGALGDVEGAVHVGCNVVAVEQDPEQFNASGAHLVRMAAETSFEYLNVPESSSSSSSTLAPTSNVSAPIQKSAKAAVAKSGVGNTAPDCIDCGVQLPAGYDETIFCHVCDNGRALHYACATRLQDGLWYCPSHMQTVAASQEESQSWSQ